MVFIAVDFGAVDFGAVDFSAVDLAGVWAIPLTTIKQLKKIALITLDYTEGSRRCALSEILF